MFTMKIVGTMKMTSTKTATHQGGPPCTSSEEVVWTFDGSNTITTDTDTGAAHAHGHTPTPPAPPPAPGQTN